MRQLLFIFLLLLPSIFFAEDGQEIMKKAYANINYYNDIESKIDLYIYNSKGDEQKKRFNSITIQRNNFRNNIIKFYKPASIKSIGLLTKKDRKKRARNQWIYFPFIKKVEKIIDSNQNSSFMGSDFTYSDIVGRELYEDEYELAGENKTSWFIKAVPKNKKSLYSKLNMIVLKSNYTIKQITFYDRKNEKLKRLVNNNIKKVKKAYFIFNSQMQNYRTNGKSVIVRNNIDLEEKYKNIGFKELKY